MDVSIIIPTYDRLWCLPRAINSCRNTKCQTEIIVIDDGSTDGTWDWLLNEPDLIIRKQHNQGQTYAINNGLKHASGKYVRFLDSDDYLNQGFIDLQFDKAEKENADLVYSRVDYFNEASKEITVCPDTGIWEDFLEVQLSSRYGSHFLGMLFKKELVDQVPRRPDFALREDRMFLLEYGLLNPKLAFVDGCAGYWVQHSEQMQGNYFGLKSQVTNWQHLNIFKKILKVLEDRTQLTVARKKAATSMLWILAHWIAKNHLKEAVEINKWIYELDPAFKIPEKGGLGFMYKRLGFKNTEKILKLRRLIKYGLN